MPYQSTEGDSWKADLKPHARSREQFLLPLERHGKETISLVFPHAEVKMMSKALFPQSDGKIIQWAQQRWGKGTKLLGIALDEDECVTSLGRSRCRKEHMYGATSKLLRLHGALPWQHQGAHDSWNL